VNVSLRLTPGVAWGGPLRMSEFGRIRRDSPLTDEAWLGIVALTKAQLARTRTLDRLRAERVKLVQQLIERSREVYGDKELADRWFKRPNLYLCGKAPEQVLDSLPGIAEAMMELARIEHGVFA